MVYYGEMSNYYGVFNGRRIGVFTDNYEAVLSVHGYLNNYWQGFATYEAAYRYVYGTNPPAGPKPPSSKSTAQLELTSSQSAGPDSIESTFIDQYSGWRCPIRHLVTRTLLTLSLLARDLVARNLWIRKLLALILLTLIVLNQNLQKLIGLIRNLLN